MKPLDTLTKDDIKDIKVVCFDVDGVTIKRGTEIEEKGTQLKIKTSPLEDHMLQKILKLKKYFHITINSGRSAMYLTKVFQEILWGDASVISENGMFIVYKGELIQNYVFNDYELDTIQKITVDLQKLANTNKLARGFEPKQFLITLHAFEAIPEVETIVKKYDTKNEFYVWWNGEAYDIAPKRFNKGSGLEKLCKKLDVVISQLMAVGNGINDKDMTDLAGIGITTDKETLKSDYFIDGEHLGGEYLMDKLLELKEG